MSDRILSERSNHVKAKLLESFRRFIWFWFVSFIVYSNRKFYCSLSNTSQKYNRMKYLMLFNASKIQIRYRISRLIYTHSFGFRFDFYLIGHFLVVRKCRCRYLSSFSILHWYHIMLGSKATKTQGVEELKTEKLLMSSKRKE